MVIVARYALPAFGQCGVLAVLIIHKNCSSKEVKEVVRAYIPYLKRIGVLRPIYKKKELKKMLFNIAAEKAILGCIMLESTLCSTVLDKICSDDFTRPEYKMLFDEIVDKFKKNERFDFITLMNLDLDTRYAMVNDIISTSSVNHYISIVKDLSTRRKFIRNLESLRLKALDVQSETETLATDLLEISSKLEFLENSDDTGNDLINILYKVTLNFENQFRNNVEMFKKWGITWLDKNTGGMKPSLTILAARPSVGKSAFLIKLIDSIGKQDARMALFGLEMSNEDNVIRLLACNGKIQKAAMDDPRMLTDESWGNISRTVGALSSYKLKMFDEIFNIDKILNKCLQIKNDTGLDFVAIDYLQLIEIDGKFGTTNDRISAITRKIKKFQQSNKIHIMLLSQLNRETEKQEYPALSNLRDSGAIEQDADSVWALHQEKIDIAATTTPDYIDLRLIILKQRGGKRNISKELKFYGKTFQFFEN